MQAYMKIYWLLLCLPLILMGGSCENQKTASNENCVNGEIRCEDSFLQQCNAGNWSASKNCAADNRQCRAVQGTALCVATGTEDAYSETDTPAPESKTVTVEFEQGDTAAGGKPVYVIWLENTQRTYIQNLFICGKLLGIGGSLAANQDPLPYWNKSKRENSNVDGLSGATVLPKFSVTKTIAPEATDNFTVYFEIDHSWDPNDWFGDQPALLYAVDVDLNAGTKKYTLAPVGWTPGRQNSPSRVSAAPSTTTGELNNEMKYITHTSSGSGFGTTDGRAAANLVKSLTVTIE